ncbi:septum site-determining protein MinC [Christensenellaceae bacterium OttesenSCG-928-K19]|nr:septum site-determining protein MinC [Christensenellaceae bacterium OttesenSCG-928-K19]
MLYNIRVFAVAQANVFFGGEKALLQNNVTIKGKENGLEIMLGEKATYPVLREELLQKLKKSQDFFKDSRTRVVIRGKSLSEAQRKEIKRVFAMDFDIHDVLYGDEADMLKSIELDIEEKPAAQEKDKNDEEEEDIDVVSGKYIDADSVFINGTVRSGQRVESEGDVVIVGDVNPGAEVIAGGSIAVFGKLRGLAHAGCGGRTDVVVAAVYMCPKQMRLSGRVVTFPKDRKAPGTAEIAELKNGKVVVRPI